MWQLGIKKNSFSLYEDVEMEELTEKFSSFPPGYQKCLQNNEQLSAKRRTSGMFNRGAKDSGRVLDKSLGNDWETCL